MEQTGKHYYAVLIGDNYTPNTPFNEAIFFVRNATEARWRGNLYCRQWDLPDERVLRVRQMTEEEYNERRADHDAYMQGGYRKYRTAN